MQNSNIYIAIGLLAFISCSPSKQLNKDLYKDPLINKVLNDPKYEAQILYTHVDLRDTSFKSNQINISQNYFYPASTVKMPVAVLALQYINELQQKGVDIKRSYELLHNANRPEQTSAISDSTTSSKLPTIERYIEKIFAVSDNDAYNRLYELLGPDYINQTLTTKGVFKDSRICHRVGVSGYTPEDNLYTTESKIKIGRKVVHYKPMAKAKQTWNHSQPNAIKGKAYMDNKDSLVISPFDFSKKNYYSLTDMEQTLQRIIFPQKFRNDQKFDITADDYKFLRKAMSSAPKDYPFYKDNNEYYDTYVKFLYYGSETKATLDPELTVYNKVGNAYGYLIDCSYFENKKAGIGFFLTAVIHVNANEIYNDGVYEYDEIGYPYMRQLGKVIYQHELRTRK